MNHFSLNIKNIREYWELSQTELGYLIGASRGMVMQYEKRGSAPKNETVSRLLQVTGLDRETLFETKIDRKHYPPLREPYKTSITQFRYKDGGKTKTDIIPDIVMERTQKLRMSLKENFKPVPMLNTKAAAGTIALIQDEPELILEFVDVPFVGIVDGAIEVVGDSMTPSFKNGARAAVRKLEDKMLLNWGEVYYIIDSNYEGYIKRVYEGDDSHIVLKSDNPDKEMYPAFKRKWENIVAIFKVKADITKH